MKRLLFKYAFVFVGLVASAAWASEIIETDNQEQPSQRGLGDVSEMTEAGRNIRGVYIPVGKVSTMRPRELVRYVKDTGANGVILDVKDDMGRVSISGQLEHAMGAVHGYNEKRIKKLIPLFKEEGIYTIARVVSFKDNLFAIKYKEQAIIDRRDGSVWKDMHELRWADPGSEMAHRHIANVAVEAARIGFDEVQLDYVRYPVEPNTRYARLRHTEDDVPRYEYIARLLKRVDESIDIPLSIDVFGLTAYHPEQSIPLGQKLEALAPYVDAISPMVYLANWPSKYYEDPKPKKTHDLIKNAVAKIRDRLGNDIVVRPLLQGFKWRAKNWGYWFLQNQIDAAENGGSQGYLFWNTRGRYGLLSRVWRNIVDSENLDKTANLQP